MEGDIQIARERPDAAATAYAAAMKRPEATASLVMYTHGVLTKAGRADRAEALANGWLADHPKDAGFVVSWSHAAMAAGDKPMAEKRLRSALEIAPNHVGALNDLAWLLASNQRPGGVALAERALAARPDSPEVLDTLALALVVDGQLDRAAQVQQQAVQKSGLAASSYNMALARIYLSQGKKELALTELNKLTALGSRFPEAQAVAKLVEAASN
jgi:Flp pilus assembly protein TadD